MNPFYICKEHKILGGIHISIVEFGISMSKSWFLQYWMNEIRNNVFPYFKMPKTGNKLHIWLECEILHGIHILFVWFGVKMPKIQILQVLKVFG